MRTPHQRFLEWYGSAANPIRSASETVRYYTDDALRAAFAAGIQAAEDIRRERVELRRAEDQRNIFQ